MSAFGAASGGGSGGGAGAAAAAPSAPAPPPPGAPTTAGAAAARGGSASAAAAAGYTCEICLDEPTEPVVTFCGHLYCWPCLFRWMHATTGTTTHHNQCPVCKSEISHNTVIPLYGRGRERDPRSAAAAVAAAAAAAAAGGGAGGGAGGAAGGMGGAGAGAGGVPARPPAQRVDPAPAGAGADEHGGGGGAGGGAGAGGGGGGFEGGGNIQFAAGFGFFPSLFGLQFQMVAGARTARGGALTAEEAHQHMLERVMLGLGGVILFFLLFL